MKSLKSSSFPTVSGLRVFIAVVSLFLIGFAVFQFPASASKNGEKPESFNSESKTNDDVFKLQPVNVEVIEPKLLDYHSPTGNLLVYSTQPAKLKLISNDSRSDFLSNNIFDDFGNPRTMTSVRNKIEGFTIGEVFLGFDKGTIIRVSADASRFSKIKLPREKSAVDGGLMIDKTKIFGGDLIAATADGKIWHVDKSGGKILFLDLNTEIKGLTIFPDDFERYGAMAGKLIAGAPQQRGIYAIDANAQFTFFSLDIKPQDIDLIEKDETLFAVSTGKNKLYSFDAKNFENKNGDILITSAEVKEFYSLHWNGAEFQVSTFKVDEEISQLTFAPVNFEAAAGSCVTSISQTENVFQWEGEYGSFDVAAPSNCNWTAISNAGWLSIIAGQNGNGNGTIRYFVTKNGTNRLRDADISVDALTHRVRQSKKAMTQCNSGLDAGNQNIGAVGGNGTVSINGNSDCAWQALSDSSWLTLSGNIFGAGNGTVSFTVATNFTAQTRLARVAFAGGTATVTQSPNLPPAINAGSDQTIALPNTASLSGSVTDDGIGNAPTISWSKISGDESVLFSNAANLGTTAIFSKEGVYVLRLTASDGYLTSTDDIQVTVNPDSTPPPPDPSTTAPIIDQTIPTNIAKSTAFLYTGANPIQTGVNPDDIKAERVGLLRGKVLSKAGQPISNAKISILDHSEFGQTKSRADGMFDLVVNGGGELTLKYEKQGFISAQREEKIDWQKSARLDDVVLIPYDENVGFIDLNSTAPVQVAEGGTISDTDGTRRSRLFFKQGTTATMTLPDNSTQSLSEMHVRSTEFTVGANGVAAMPGDLPATSQYTYAAEYSVDEAVALDAVGVAFSQPVVQYLENFLSFPVGIAVPSGFYNRQTGNWEASPSGRIVKVLAVSNGIAELDLDGNGQPAGDTDYAALGINLAERQKLAEIYPVNQSLWRVPLDHFTPQDLNYPPSTAVSPNGGKGSGDQEPEKKCKAEGCIINVQSQTLREEIRIVGTDFSLNYNSAWQKGRIAARSLTIPLSGATIPKSLVGIKLSVEIAGRTFNQSFPAQPNQTTTFTWDGKDAYGRELQGKQPATVKVDFVYPLTYQTTGVFGNIGNGSGVMLTRSGGQAIITDTQQFSVGSFDHGRSGLGGWTLNVHHIYDPVGKVLYQGDGNQREVQTINDIANTAAGSGNSGFGGDGGLATQASLAGPSGIAVAPDGSYYIADSFNNRIRRVSSTGIISTVAGSNSPCNPTDLCGDGGAATQAQLFVPTGLALSTDGSLYISDKETNRIRKISPDGIITTIAGNGEECLPTENCGDGGAANLAKLNKPQYIHLASDGTLFIADSGSRRIRRIGTNGIITTVAGNGKTDCAADDVPAQNACLAEPSGLALAADGSLYISDTGGILLNSDRIFRVDTNGIIKTLVEQSGCNNALTEAHSGGIQHSICDPQGLTTGPDGKVYFVASLANRLLKIESDGTLTAVAGDGFSGFNGDGRPALQATISYPVDTVFAPNGTLYIAEQGGQRIRQIRPALPGFSNTDIIIPSEDGSEVFQFNRDGKHLRTINSLTGADKYVFGYDDSGRLTMITDGDGNITTVERGGAGNPTVIRSPYNQLTTLSLNSNGYFSAISNPANETHRFTYTSDGLMLTEKDPLNNQNTFTFDSLGRLLRDDDAATGFQTYARDNPSRNYTVTRNTALKRTTTYQVQKESDGAETTTNTFPDGTVSQQISGADGVDFSTDPSGTINETRLEPDPRFQMQSPITSNEITTTPGGLIFSSEFTREATLANPLNPLSLTSQTDTLILNGKTYTNIFTANNRTFTDTSPLNRQTTTVINNQNRPTQIQFADLNAVNFTYDSRGRLNTITSGKNLETRTSSFDYNTAGFLSSSTNPLNQTSNFTYDPAGRLTRKTLADNRETLFGYDSNGNLTSVTPPSRPAHIITYNSVNLVSSYAAPNVGGGSTTNYNYNSDKQITNITRPDSLQINYAYDAAGRLAVLTVPNGNYGFTYNKTTGLIDQITAPGGENLAYEYDGMLPTKQIWTGIVAGSVSQSYNNDFLVSSQKINDGNAIDFIYDNDDALIGAGSLTLTRNAQNGLLSGTILANVTDTFSYNNFGEAINYNAKFNAATLYDVNYVYDKLGHITQKTENIGGVSTTYAYGYDATGRLATVTLNGAPQPLVIYGYDDNDNRTSINVGGNLTGATYDNQDRLLNYGATTYAYTLNGELRSKTIAGNTTVYNYDAVGNLRSVGLPDATQIEYLIDGQNRRIGKKVNGNLTQGFLYENQLEPVAELDANNNLISRFVYGTRPHTPDYMIKNGATYRIITDQLGSIRLVVDVATGSIAQRIDYDEFGVVLFDTNPNFQPFGFAGGLYDSQTGLTRFGARDYDAETGRWTAKDPKLFTGKNTNLYNYAANDPVNKIDYNGFDEVDTHKIPNPSKDPANFEAGVEKRINDLFKSLDMDRIMGHLKQIMDQLKRIQKEIQNAAKKCDFEKIKELKQLEKRLEKQLSTIIDAAIARGVFLPIIPIIIPSETLEQIRNGGVSTRPVQA